MANTTRVRRVRRCTLVVLIGAVAVLAAACGSGSGPATISIGTLRAAAANSQAADTQTFAFTMGITSKGQHVDMTGSGTVASDGSAGHMTMDMGDLGKIEAIVTPDGLYYDMGALLGDKLPAGKRWVYMSYDALSQKSGQDFRQLQDQSNQNSTKALEYLKSTTGDVEKVGDDTVAGRPATHYVTHLDYAKFAEEKMPDATAAEKAQIAKLGTVPMDVWIDGDDRVVKMRFEMDGSSLGSSGGSVTMTMEITAFGQPVDATPPPADQVIDISELLGTSTA
jgi:hypothetical protein